MGLVLGHPSLLSLTFSYSAGGSVYFGLVQGISNIVWALGQLGHPSPPLLSAIGMRLSRPGALLAFDSQVCLMFQRMLRF